MPLSIKILFAPEDGRLLGAQVVGFGGVDKRIEMLAQVIQRKGTVYDLTELEHAYAPPYSAAKDPVNMAGFVAENLLTEKRKRSSGERSRTYRQIPYVSMSVPVTSTA